MLRQCLTKLIAPLQTQAEAMTAAKGASMFAVSEMMHRIAVFLQHCDKTPDVVSDALPEVWTLVKRYIELASTQEQVVESAVKIVMCALARTALPASPRSLLSSLRLAEITMRLLSGLCMYIPVAPSPSRSFGDQWTIMLLSLQQSSASD